MKIISKIIYFRQCLFINNNVRSADVSNLHVFDTNDRVKSVCANATVFESQNSII